MSALTQSESVISGFWRDHDLPRWRNAQLLVRDQSTQMISNTVAVALTLTLPRLLIFVKLVLPFCTKQLSRWYRHIVRMRSRASTVFREQTRRSCTAEPDQSTSIELAILRTTHQEPRPRINADEQSQRSRTAESDQPTSVELATLRATHQEPRSRISAGVLDTFNQSSSFENAAGNILKQHVAMGRVELGENSNGIWRKCLFIIRNFKENAWASTWLSALVLLLFLIFIGQQVIAISVANIVSDSVAISTSPNCRSWAPDIPGDRFSNVSVFAPLEEHYSRLTRKTIAYAESCYGESARPEECAYFYQSRIPFREIHNASCPFEANVCRFGETSAFQLDTGYIDSNLLGINEEHRCEFRLKKTCAPLVVDKPYAQFRVVENGTVIAEYYFGNFYGLKGGGNRTFVERTPVPRLQLPGKSQYKITVMQQKSRGDPDHPPEKSFRAEFLTPNSDIGLSFISAPGIMYIQPSDDPIFPAVTSPGTVAGDRLYWNNLQRANVLACVDTAEVRHPRSGAILFPKFGSLSELNSPVWLDPSVDRSVHIFNMSLLDTRPFKIGYPTMGMQFDANNKIRGFYSLPLDKEQWKIEARRMFSFKLARLQLDVLGAAQGLGWDLPYAKNWFLEYGLNGCPEIKFRAQGWKNIDLFGLVTLILLAISLWAFTIEAGETITLIWLWRQFITPALYSICSMAADLAIKSASCIWCCLRLCLDAILRIL